MVVSPSPKHRSDKGYRRQGFRNSPGSLAMLAALHPELAYLIQINADPRFRRRHRMGGSE